MCDLRITISTTKANQTRMSPTSTHSRSSMDLIHNNTMNIGGMSIADYIFAEVTEMSGQYNINA